VRSFAIVTAVPNELCARLHNRMPVVLAPEAWPAWLGEEPADEAQLKSLLAPTLPMRWFAGPSVRVSAMSRTTIRIWSSRFICRDTVSSLPGSGALKSMPEPQIAQALQLLDLMLEHFADDGHWTRGRYDDGNGGHCLVGALLHLSRKHRLPRAPAIALLQDAMPRPGLPLVHFNDTCCGSVTELRSIILKAHRLADDHAERERAAAAAKAWLLAQIEKKRAASAPDIMKTPPHEPFSHERLAA
jgi:hypothetical protein